MKHLLSIHENFSDIYFEYEKEYGTRKKGTWLFDYPGNERLKRPIVIDSGKNDVEEAKIVIFKELQDMGLLGTDVDDVDSNMIVDMTPGYRFVVERFMKWKPQLTFDEYIKNK